MRIEKRFDYMANPARIVFGRGSLASLRNELTTHGCRRALVLSTAFQRPQAEAVADMLGTLAAGIFSDAIMHTPVGVTKTALAVFEDVDADCIVAFGGGSTIGLGKAIAYRNDAPQFVIVTTYAGSEVTSILGQTENGIKTTVRDPKILPEVVIYDSELTMELPVRMSMNSGLNAMAHAVEGLYAQEQNPISTLMAVEGIRALKTALPAISADPKNADARNEALYGSWLCGSVLGTVGMALHHKLCHTLGGAFDLPHAEVHAIMLPHSMAYNALAAAEALSPATALFGNPIGAGLYDFAASLGAPLALRELGLPESALDLIAELAVENPYWNPRPIERQAIRSLLQNAWEGTPPQ